MASSITKEGPPRAAQQTALPWDDADEFARERFTRDYDGVPLWTADVREALHQLPIRLLRAAELDQKEISAGWMGSEAAYRSSPWSRAVSLAAQFALLPDLLSEPCGPADIHSRAYRLFWDYLEQKGLRPRFETRHVAGGAEHHIMVTVPDALRAALKNQPVVDDRPGLFAGARRELSAFCGAIERLARDAAGRFSDAHTREFAEEARRLAQPAEGLAYEKLICAVDAVPAKAAGFNKALSALAMCGYLGEAGRPAAPDAVQQCAALTRMFRASLIGQSLDGNWREIVQGSAAQISHVLFADLAVGSEHELRDRKRLLDVAQFACLELCRAIELVQTICPPGPAADRRTVVESAETLTTAKLKALTALVASLPSPAQLKQREGLTGGAIDHNYYDPVFFAALAAKGELLVTQTRKAAGGLERIAGFVCCKGPDVELLAVAADAPPETAIRLLDRMILEQQGKGYQTGKAALMAINVSSFKVITSKCWLPLDIPVEFVPSQDPHNPLLWFSGEFSINPALRRVAVPLAAAGSGMLRSQFLGQARRNAGV